MFSILCAFQSPEDIMMYCCIQSIMNFFRERILLGRGRIAIKIALHSEPSLCPSCVKTIQNTSQENHEFNELITDACLARNTQFSKLLVGAEYLLCYSLYPCVCVSVTFNFLIVRKYT